eukprot:359586-Chlamydomonas_euryale.AAC.25
MAHVEPLPLVPATWMMLSLSRSPRMPTRCGHGAVQPRNQGQGHGHGKHHGSQGVMRSKGVAAVEVVGNEGSQGVMRSKGVAAVEVVGNAGSQGAMRSKGVTAVEAHKQSHKQRRMRGTRTQ